MKNEFDNQVRLQLLNLLKNDPNLTQRRMNQKMGVSLGKINYCLSTLSEKGMVKVERFLKSDNKPAYMYKITPSGFQEITRLTLKFLKLKINEYESIKHEITRLSEHLNEIGPDHIGFPEIQKELDRIKEEQSSSKS